MQGTIRQPYTWDGKNTAGLAEVLQSAKVYIANTPVAVVRLIKTDATSGFIEADVDLAAGANSFQIAPIDDEGTEGARTNCTVTVADSAPDPFGVPGTASWRPKT